MSKQGKNEKKQTQLSTQTNGSNAAGTVGALGKMFGRTFLTVLIIVVTALVALLIGILVYVNSYSNESLDLDLHDLRLNYTTFIYTTDSKGKETEYQALYGGDNNRVWVDFDEIPQAMKDAMVAIEDKRFYEHDGVDWNRTIGAAATMSSSGASYGGSTITQQLIKNLTGDNDVSITRKMKEIFRAVNLEKQYSKDEILEAYLNVVDYGSGTKGVQAAAHLYFNKDISKCDVAECAAIAGITQNPYAYNPLQFPEKNKERQQIVIEEMHNQEKITDDEYNAAMKKSENMKFYGKVNGKKVGEVSVFDWYTEAMISDVVEDLMKLYNCSEEEASHMIYYNGLKIHSAMDVDLQKQAEKIFKESEIFQYDPDLEVGFYMMDYSGRVLTVIGSSHEKTGNRWMSNATDALRQVGSTMKPISVYTPAMEYGYIGYTSALKDDPLPNYFADGTPGPNNWYSGSRGNMPVYKAIEISANRPAAQLCNTITPQLCYQFMTQNLHVGNLIEEIDGQAISSMALGGMSQGLTVKDMTAAFQIFGNEGQYAKPFTYYYIEDAKGNIILDNRNNKKEQACSAGTAEVMNKILQKPIYGSEGTGTDAQISGWTVYGKTGTTDSNKDSWFMGGTPYAIAGIWTGYTEPSQIYSQTSLNAAKTLWRQVMTYYLESKEQKEFNYDAIEEATLCTSTGKMAGGGCRGEVGWIAKDRMDDYCDGYHAVQRGGREDDDEEEEEEEEEESSSSEESSEEESSSSEESKPKESSSEPASSKEPESSNSKEPASSSSKDPEPEPEPEPDPEPEPEPEDEEPTTVTPESTAGTASE